jgi:hypothetical protein
MKRIERVEHDLSDSSSLPAETEDLLHRIIGCALEVHTQLGAGYVEAVYQKAMCVELRHQGLGYQYPSYPFRDAFRPFVSFVPFVSSVMSFVSFVWRCDSVTVYRPGGDYCRICPINATGSPLEMGGVPSTYSTIPANGARTSSSTFPWKSVTRPMTVFCATVCPRSAVG